MSNQIVFNERASLNRPAWTSTVETGNFEAYKHFHVSRNGRFELLKNYFTK